MIAYLNERRLSQRQTIFFFLLLSGEKKKIFVVCDSPKKKFFVLRSFLTNKRKSYQLEEEIMILSNGCDILGISNPLNEMFAQRAIDYKRPV